MGGQRSVLAFLLLAGCSLDGAAPGDAGAGAADAAASDLSSPQFPDDFPTLPDLADSVDLRYPACPLPCGNKCAHPCKTDAGVQKKTTVGTGRLLRNHKFE